MGAVALVAYRTALTGRDRLAQALSAGSGSSAFRFLTRYSHSCWQYYQRSWYQRLFLWTPSSRAHYADEAQVRRTLRLSAIAGLAMGVFVLAIEFSALITGHVI
jgi:hypothetical protein